MKITKGGKKLIRKILNETKKKSPILLDDEVNKLVLKKFKKTVKAKQDKGQRKKRAGARKRNSKGKYTESSGNSVRAVSGGGVSPR